MYIGDDVNLSDKQIAPERSSFVTVVAWIFIVIAGFGSFISILQNVMINTMFPMDQMQAATSSASSDHIMPAIMGFMFGHIRLFFATFLALSLSTFISAIALLKRKNWARMIFISLLVFGIVWNIGSIFFQYVFFGSMPPVPANAPADFRSEFDSIATVMMIFSSVMAIGFSALFGWIIKRLISPVIRSEFA